MKLVLCLLYTALHITIGCIISEPKAETIIRSSGESVLLHCSCTDGQIKLNEIRWRFHTKHESYNLIGDLTEADKKRFSGRLHTFNAKTPGNASLLLSNLAIEDQGEYECEIESNEGGLFRVIKLIIKSCIISEPVNETIIRSPGQSVLLHCSCTDLKSKLDEIKWSFHNKTKCYNLIGEMAEAEKKMYSGRVQTFNAKTPGNASLLLSDLTEEDQGEYICETESNGDETNRVITLIIKSCIISQPKEETIIRSPGESVLLHCSCTDLQIKPDEFQWSLTNEDEFYNLIGDLNEDEKKRYNGRVQTFNASTPGNASLLLSKLTEEDQGDYMCEIINKKYSQYTKQRTITVNINGFSGSGTGKGTSATMFVVIIIILLVVLLGTAAVIFWSKRKKRIGSSDNRGKYSGEEQQQNEEVTYSTVVHGSTARAAPRETNTEETTEYSSIRTDRV